MYTLTVPARCTTYETIKALHAVQRHLSSKQCKSYETCAMLHELMGRVIWGKLGIACYAKHYDMVSGNW